MCVLSRSGTSVLRRSFAQPSFQPGSLFCLGCKGAGTFAPVQKPDLLGAVPLHPQRKIEECAVQHRAIVVGEIDEPGFLHEPAQLDQMPGSFAPCHDPFPGIGPCPCRIMPIAGLSQAPCRPRQCQQRGARIADSFPERTVRRAHSISS